MIQDDGQEPCPFCGEPFQFDRVYHDPKADNPGKRELWAIKHNSPGCPVNFDRGFASRAEAIAASNRRASPIHSGEQ